MIWFLHGMLGTGEDLQWSGRETVKRVDLWKDVRPFDEWARRFSEMVRASPDRSEQRILVGYSMGGRLAMHALLADPTIWNKAILVSAHPGLEDAAERGKRVAADLRWAESARELPWDEFLKRWNSQAVFEESALVDRSAAEFQREAIARAFELWSLGRQEPLGEKLQLLACPTLCITGERDHKFGALADTLSLPHARGPGCGHRVLAENPNWLEAQILEFASAST